MWDSKKRSHIVTVKSKALSKIRSFIKDREELRLLVSAYFRMHGKIDLCCATTGTAALNHSIKGSVYGYTAHSLFGIPVIQDGRETLTVNKIASTLDAGSQRCQLLAAADVIFWDEMPMANRLHLISCIFKLALWFLLENSEDTI